MTHPYADAADHRLWRRAVGNRGTQTDPVVEMPFRIAPNDRMVSAGSCFSQHISRRLKESGYNFLITEPAHPIVSPTVADRHNFERFTARYGNIYTARQLLQLLRRAYGRFTPTEDIWEGPEGGFVDPFRPQIQPGGFATRAEYEADRTRHFAAVRTAFEQADVFIFTLGLTEAWESSVDGAVFTLCPGTAGGTFDPDRHEFHNFEIEEVVADLEAFIAELRAINPKVRLILTVSPVPMVATATDNHILAASTYSKSLLRVAADMVVRRHRDVAYFPGYEVVVGPQIRGRYFGDDLRSITEEGVDRVMDLFFEHATTEGRIQGFSGKAAEKPDEFLDMARQIAEALCDEEMLDPDNAKTGDS
jgi:hypothetical protein